MSSESNITLDYKYFKVHADFKADWKEASKDSMPTTRWSPSATLRSLVIPTRSHHGCHDGFEPCVYAIYAGVRESLCDNIKTRRPVCCAATSSTSSALSSWRGVSDSRGG